MPGLRQAIIQPPPEARHRLACESTKKVYDNMTKNRPTTRGSTIGDNMQNSFIDRGSRDRYGRPQRDLRPVLLGALMGAVVTTLLLIVYLLGTNSRSSTRGGQAVVTPPINTDAKIPTIVVSTDNQTNSDNQTNVPDDAPRIALKDFKKRYDDPAKRPLIIDVRQKDDYEQGHIKGAISFPQDQVDNRVGELPKDKLIIAYCD